MKCLTYCCSIRSLGRDPENSAYHDGQQDSGNHYKSHVNGQLPLQPDGEGEVCEWLLATAVHGEASRSALGPHQIKLRALHVARYVNAIVKVL